MINDYAESVQEELTDVCCKLSLEKDEALKIMLIVELKKIGEYLQGTEFNLRRFGG